MFIDFVNVTYSQNVSLGENATFLCEGHGSYIYWFIDGENIANMTMQERTDRGLIEEPVNGSYCTSQSCQNTSDQCFGSTNSTMGLAGNCLNNNRNISCLIFCCQMIATDTGCSYSSAIVRLAVEGTKNIKLYTMQDTLQKMSFMHILNFRQTKSLNKSAKCAGKIQC